MIFHIENYQKEMEEYISKMEKYKKQLEAIENSRWWKLRQILKKGNKKEG